MKGLLSGFKKTATAASKEASAKKKEDAERMAKEQKAKEEEDRKLKEAMEKQAISLEELRKTRASKPPEKILPFHMVKDRPSVFNEEFQQLRSARDQRQIELAHAREMGEISAKDARLLAARRTDPSWFYREKLDYGFADIETDLFAEFLSGDKLIHMDTNRKLMAAYPNLKLLAIEFIADATKSGFYAQIEAFVPLDGMLPKRRAYPHRDGKEFDDVATVKDSLSQYAREFQLVSIPELFRTLETRLKETNDNIKILTLQHKPSTAKNYPGFEEAAEAIKTRAKNIDATHDEIEEDLKKLKPLYKPLFFEIFKMLILWYFIKYDRLISTPDEVFSLFKENLVGITTMRQLWRETEGNQSRLEELSIVPNLDKPFTPTHERAMIRDIVKETVDKYAHVEEYIALQYGSEIRMRIDAASLHKTLQEFYKSIQSITLEEELEALLETLIQDGEKTYLKEYNAAVKDFMRRYHGLKRYATFAEVSKIATVSKAIQNLYDSFNGMYALYPRMMRGYVECFIIAMKIDRGITLDSGANSILDILKDAYGTSKNHPRFLYPFDVGKDHMLAFRVGSSVKGSTLTPSVAAPGLASLKKMEQDVYAELVAESRVEIMASCNRIHTSSNKTHAAFSQQLSEMLSVLADDVVKYEEDVKEYKDTLYGVINPSRELLDRAHTLLTTKVKKSMQMVILSSSLASFIHYEKSQFREGEPDRKRLKVLEPSITYERIISLANGRYPVLRLLQGQHVKPFVFKGLGKTRKKRRNTRRK